MNRDLLMIYYLTFYKNNKFIIHTAEDLPYKFVIKTKNKTSTTVFFLTYANMKNIAQNTFSIYVYLLRAFFKFIFEQLKSIS